MKFRLIVAGILLAYAVEIVVRRAFWNQLPTQLSPPVVYAVVGLDVLAAVWIFASRARAL